MNGSTENLKIINKTPSEKSELSEKADVVSIKRYNFEDASQDPDIIKLRIKLL